MIRNVTLARKRLIVVIAVLGLIDLAVLVFLFSPAVGSGRAARSQNEALNKDLAQKRLQTMPALDMDKKLTEARGQITDFYSNHLPDRYSEIAQAVAKAAEESHVQVANVRYETKQNEGKTPDGKLIGDSAAAHGLVQVNLAMDIGGGYENEIRFLNALERSKLLMVIESVNLAEAQGGILRLGIRVQTFLRMAES